MSILDRTKNLGSSLLVAFTVLNTPAALAQDSDAETQPPQPPALTDIDTYLAHLDRHDGIDIKPSKVSEKDKKQIQALREQFPGVDFVKLRALDKYVTTSLDHVSLDADTGTLTATDLDFSDYSNSLIKIYLNPFSSWPPHTVLTFNGHKVDKNEICAFIPNEKVGDSIMSKIPRRAIDEDFNIDWDFKEKGIGREGGVSAHQRIDVSKLPVELFDANNLTCVVIETPDSSTMRKLSEADLGEWVTVHEAAEP